MGWAEGAGGLVVWSGGSVPLNTGSGGRYAAIPNTNQVIETWGLRTQDLRDSGTQDLREPECQMAGIGGEGGIRTLGTAKTVRRLSKPVQSTTLPPLRTRSADMTGSHPHDPNMWGPQQLRNTNPERLQGVVVNSHDEWP